MNEEEKKAAEAKASAEAQAKAEADAKAQAEADAKPPQENPVKKELEKVKAGKLSKKERLEFAKNKIEQQLEELDEAGDETPTPSGEDEPLTLKKYRELEKEKGKKTAMELADTIEDKDERDLAKHYLETRIVPSGNPEEDVKMARAAVNAVKNAHIAEEAIRSVKPKAVGTAPGAPARQIDTFTPTSQEQVFMQPPYNLSKDDILKARAKAEAKLPRE